MTTQTSSVHLYDHPQYYDLVFGSDWKAELDFLLGCFDKHARRVVRRVFEPACGTGRLLYRLAQKGHQVSGLDLNSRAVEYCNARLERKGFCPTVRVGDMSDFRLPRPVDAAFNMINSFRHLPSEQTAAAHLQCVADCLRLGGLYVLGLHLTPSIGQAVESESWSARRGHLCVNTRMWLLQRDLDLRQERFALTCDVHTPTQRMHLADELVLRTYRAEQLAALLGRVPQLEVAAVYDFAYDLQQPIEVGPATEDAVYVLRKRT